MAWQVVTMMGVVPAFMLPSPVSVVRAFVGDFRLLMSHTATTLFEAGLGLLISILSAFILAMVMDRSRAVYRSLYPLLLLTQTIPVVAIAPLLVLWMGSGAAPKIMLIFLVCFFPITIGLLDGFGLADPDTITLLRSMGASDNQIFWQLKFPGALPRFFSGLKIAVSYCVIGSVIAGWLGGNSGLGVYMTRVRRSYEFDKMFAVIFLVSGLSIALVRTVAWLEIKSTPWLRRGEKT